MLSIATNKTCGARVKCSEKYRTTCSSRILTRGDIRGKPQQATGLLINFKMQLVPVDDWARLLQYSSLTPAWRTATSFLSLVSPFAPSASSRKGETAPRLLNLTSQTPHVSDDDCPLSSVESEAAKKITEPVRDRPSPMKAINMECSNSKIIRSALPR